MKKGVSGRESSPRALTTKKRLHFLSFSCLLDVLSQPPPGLIAARGPQFKFQTGVMYESEREGDDLGNLGGVFVNTSKAERGIIDIGTEREGEGTWDNPSPRNETDTCRCQNLTLHAILRLLRFGGGRAKHT